MDKKDNILTFYDRDNWLAARRDGIGASDSPILLGLSPWKTPKELWAEKLGLIESTSMTEPMKWGIWLEAGIIQGYREMSGRVVAEMQNAAFQIHVHPEHSFMRATPDTFVWESHSKGVVQIKNVGAHQRQKWEDVVPIYYDAQVQHEMYVTGCEFGYLVVLFGGQELVEFPIERNERYIEFLLNKCSEFWSMVTSNREPADSEDGRDAMLASRMFPRDNGGEVLLPPQAVEWREVAEKAKESAKLLDEVKKKHEGLIRGAIRECAYGIMPDGSGKYSYKVDSRGVRKLLFQPTKK